MNNSKSLNSHTTSSESSDKVDKKIKTAGREILANKDDIEPTLIKKANIRYQDSFFRRLFKEPKYRKALYLILHQEDINVEDTEFENIELDNILNVDIYNDICFTVRNHVLP